MTLNQSTVLKFTALACMGAATAIFLLTGNKKDTSKMLVDKAITRVEDKWLELNKSDIAVDQKNLQMAAFKTRVRLELRQDLSTEEVDAAIELFDKAIDGLIF